jgi:peptidoglycan hydrolase-like protein with peptidoglycan-binding domain
MKFILSLLPFLAVQAVALSVAADCGASLTVAGVTIPVAQDAKAADTCTLQIKSTGDGVKALQTAINACYKPVLKNGEPLKVDGDFGPKTEAAFKSVQEKIGVPADGVYGLSVRAKLLFPDASGKCVAFSK